MVPNYSKTLAFFRKKKHLQGFGHIEDIVIVKRTEEILIDLVISNCCNSVTFFVHVYYI